MKMLQNKTQERDHSFSCSEYRCGNFTVETVTCETKSQAPPPENYYPATEVCWLLSSCESCVNIRNRRERTLCFLFSEPARRTKELRGKERCLQCGRCQILQRIFKDVKTGSVSDGDAWSHGSRRHDALALTTGVPRITEERTLSLADAKFCSAFSQG